MNYKWIAILFIMVLALVGCNNGEVVEEPISQKGETEEPNDTEAIIGLSEEQMIAASHELLEIWYKRLEAKTKEALQPVNDILKSPDALKGAVEVFFDKGLNGMFEDIKIETDNDRALVASEKQFVYQGEVTVTSTNKERGQEESFKENITMLVEKFENGEFKIVSIQGKMVEE